MARIERAEWRVEYGDGRAETVEATLAEGLAELRFETREAITLALLGTEGQRALEVVRSILWKLTENVKGVIQILPEDPGILARTLKGKPVLADCGFVYRNGVVHMLEKDDGTPLPTCVCETNTCMLSELSAAPQLFTKNAGGVKARLFDHCTPMRSKREASALDYLFAGEHVREWRTFAGKELPGGGTAKGVVLQSVEAAHAPWNAYADPARLMREANGEAAPAERPAEPAIEERGARNNEPHGPGYDAGSGGSYRASREPFSAPVLPLETKKQPAPQHSLSTEKTLRPAPGAPSERSLPEPPPPKPLRTEYRVSAAPAAKQTKKPSPPLGTESAPQRTSKQERIEAENAAQIAKTYDLLCAPHFEAVPAHANAYDQMLAEARVAKQVQEALKRSLYAARGAGKAEFLGATLSLTELNLLLKPANERVDAYNEKLALLAREETATRPFSA